MEKAGSVPSKPGNPLWLLAEVTYKCPLHCVFCYNPTDFARTIELVRTGQVRPSAQSSALAKLADASDIFQRLAEGSSGKVLLELTEPVAPPAPTRLAVAD